LIRRLCHPATLIGACLLLHLAPPVQAITLKEAYEAAPAASGYDRYIVLQNGVTYTGGLMVGRVFSPVTNTYQMDELGEDVAIVGNGAVLDLQGEQICMSYCDNRLDISDCVITGGNVRYRGDNDNGLELQPVGSVTNVTFFEPHDYGVRLQGAGSGISIEGCLFIDVVDTGLDFIPSTGISGELLPTGTAVAASIQTGDYGWPWVADNWTYFGNAADNAEALHHFAFL
jgi:hypothetical protein